MNEQTFELNILSPEKTIFSGKVTKVALPGAAAPFTVLRNHAPLVSSLQKGVIRWLAGAPGEIAIKDGFVEVKNNVVTVCVEIEQ